MPDMSCHFAQKDILPQGARVIRRLTPPPAWATADTAILDALKSRPGHVVAALTGGVASGKTSVAALLCAFGAVEIDLDLLAREVVQPEHSGWLKIKDLLGPKYFLASGHLNRPKMAEVIFKNEKLRGEMENIIHPLCWNLMGRLLRQFAQEQLIIVSIPLLFEAGLETFFCPTILSFTDQETQMERLLNRKPKLGKSLAKKLIKSQWPLLEKITRTNFIIDNSGHLAKTIEQCKYVWQALTNYAPSNKKPE